MAAAAAASDYADSDYAEIDSVYNDPTFESTLRE